MLPMCYPADHYDGNFIPNWAMWFVLELEEYIKRSGDCAFAERAKSRVYGLIQYFATFENEYGLLEKLEKWVFVEWSRANDPDVVQDVNFPTNMLYARMLQIAGRLYGDSALLEKSQKLQETIRQRSFNGLFFTDNERRTAHGLENPGNITEVCQYYAFSWALRISGHTRNCGRRLCRSLGRTGLRIAARMLRRQMRLSGIICGWNFCIWMARRKSCCRI